jgi:hypothetical protein
VRERTSPSAVSMLTPSTMPTSNPGHHAEFPASQQEGPNLVGAGLWNTCRRPRLGPRSAAVSVSVPATDATARRALWCAALLRRVGADAWLAPQDFHAPMVRPYGAQAFRGARRTSSGTGYAPERPRKWPRPTPRGPFRQALACSQEGRAAFRGCVHGASCCRVSARGRLQGS